MAEKRYHTVTICIAGALIAVGVACMIVGALGYYRSVWGNPAAFGWLFLMIGGWHIPHRFTAGVLVGISLTMLSPAIFEFLGVWTIRG